MRKLKYQGGLTKLICSKIATNNRNFFVKIVDNHLGHLVSQIGINSSVPINIVSFSSNRDFEEQVLSILSFLQNVGKPKSWSLYSDGSHSGKQLEILRSNFDFLNIVSQEWDNLTELPQNTKPELLPYAEYFLDYAKKVALGKRLYYYLNHVVEFPTLFIDSDIIFYTKASTIEFIIQEDVNGWYLPDSDWGCLDSRYKLFQPRQVYQVNGGCFMLNKNLSEMKGGLDFFKSLNKRYEYFSDQNIFHILLRDNGFLPFDPRLFILDSTDQFDFSYKYHPKDIAIRHYTGPVRHKMWQKDYKWHLSLK
jgi:hypothetical protein